MFRGDDAFSLSPHDTGRLGGEAHQFFYAGPRLGYGEVFEQCANLHDEGHLPGGEVFPDDDRGNERQRHQYVGLDVKVRHQADDCLQNNGQAAENDGYPCGIKRKRVQAKKADGQKDAGNAEKCDVPPRAAPRKQRFQPVDDVHVGFLLCL